MIASVILSMTPTVNLINTNAIGLRPTQLRENQESIIVVSREKADALVGIGRQKRAFKFYHLGESGMVATINLISGKGN